MALQLWETLKGSIVAYTDLSPAAFFTVVALSLAVYYVVSGLFGSSSDHHQRPRDFQEQMQPLPPPVQLGEISEEELRQYDGADRKKPLLMAIKGQIYDVSQSRYAAGPPCFWAALDEIVTRSSRGSGRFACGGRGLPDRIVAASG
ncbi:membrane steroid-binding protein 2-like [Syzygium oleosum]|uniref:membrane steroid-binding protein 2-like n=1 Tax=Syzygium oleosum TaxID=219896 RepID=UPI0024B941D5|nr:membrane steroid-binding protein 2-like [Syzygium oleosum]